MNGDSQTDTRNEPLVHPTEGNLRLLAGMLEPCMYPPKKAQEIAIKSGSQTARSWAPPRRNQRGRRKDTWRRMAEKKRN